MLATLLLSQGTPMLYSGDEFGNGQGGNNNAYCQDNEIGWLDWPNADEALIAFTAEPRAAAPHVPLLHHARWFAVPQADETDKADEAEAAPYTGTGAIDRPALRWFHPDGHAMRDPDWRDDERRRSPPC